MSYLTKLPSQWTVTGDSTANAAVTITKAAQPNKKHYITAIEAVVSGAAVGAADVAVELRDGSTVKWKSIIGAAAVQGTRVVMAFSHPVELSTNAAANLYAAAGGTGVIITLNMAGFTA
ncbi:MAG: hypothetical protein A4E53_00148 [Pelotomaculum sp. PtaB.Bin104]|nr:MAG: hypothetical protein A4E53_00148 [Pelotomaculum sp. PtaB.Bin104]